MRLTSTIAAAALITIGATFAVTDEPDALISPFKDSMRAELADQGNISPVNRKNVKLLTKALDKTCVEGLTEAQQIKLFKKFAGKVDKKFGEDPLVADGISETLVLIDDEIVETIDEAQTNIDGAEPGKKTKKAQKLVDSATKANEKARAASSPKKQAAKQFGAHKKAVKALLLSEVLPPSTQDDVVWPELFEIGPNGSGEEHLFHVNFDGPMPVGMEVDTGPGGISRVNPAPSECPDGGCVAFEQDADRLVIVDVAGPPSVATVPQASEWFGIAWSGDASVVAACGLNPDVIVACNPATGAIINSLDATVSSLNTNAIPPLRVSFDGQFAVYRALDDSGDGTTDLYCWEIATGDVRQVTDTTDIGDLMLQSAMSPNANEIFWVANQGQPSEPPRLWRRVLEDDTPAQPISLLGEWVDPSGSAEGDLAISPDGQCVIYRARPGGNTRDLVSVNRDGTGHAMLGSTPKSQGINQVAFLGESGDRVLHRIDAKLTLCDRDGQNAVLVSSSCPDALPSPDRSGCAYREGPGGFSNGNILMACDSQGGNVTQLCPDLTPNANCEAQYAWTKGSSGLGIVFVNDSREIASPDIFYRPVPELEGGSDSGEPLVVSAPPRFSEIEELRALVVPGPGDEYEDIYIDTLAHDSQANKNVVCHTVVRSYGLFPPPELLAPPVYRDLSPLDILLLETPFGF